MTLTPHEAVTLIRDDGRDLDVPDLEPGDVRKIIELPLGSGGRYAEVYVALAWDPGKRTRRRPGASVFRLARSATGDWTLEGGSCDPAADAADLDAALARLEAEQVTFRPKPVAPRAPARPRPRPMPLTEEDGIGTLLGIEARGTPPRATHAEVDAAERALATRMPAGYRTFVVELGVGLYGGRVRMYPPARVVDALAGWRERIERFWFWGETPLSHSAALECVCLADTLDGDEIVFHPSDPDALFLLPRESERARSLGRGLAKALAKLIRAKRPLLEATKPGPA